MDPEISKGYGSIFKYLNFIDLGFHIVHNKRRAHWTKEDVFYSGLLSVAVPMISRI